MRGNPSAIPEKVSPALSTACPAGTVSQGSGRASTGERSIHSGCDVLEFSVGGAVDNSRVRHDSGATLELRRQNQERLSRPRPVEASLQEERLGKLPCLFFRPLFAQKGPSDRLQEYTCQGQNHARAQHRALQSRGQVKCPPNPRDTTMASTRVASAAPREKAFQGTSGYASLFPVTTANTWTPVRASTCVANWRIWDFSCSLSFTIESMAWGIAGIYPRMKSRKSLCWL